MSENIVQIENLVKRYGNLVALDHLNLKIAEGEIFGLLGPNGSGKTTAINCMLSLLKYDKGTIRIFGEDMRPDNYKVKQQIGIVLQNVAVFDELTVYENIDYFCGLTSRTRKKGRPLWRKPSPLQALTITAKCTQKSFPADCSAVSTLPAELPTSPV